MAHFVGKTLGTRPSVILSTWGVPELLVAYSVYANEISEQNYRDWKSIRKEERDGLPMPKRYAVFCLTNEEFFDDEEVE